MHAPTALRTAILGGVIALLAAACAAGGASPSSAAGASASAPASAAAPAASGSAVTIQDFAFAPSTLTVPVGTTVVWTNQDSADHTVTADDGSFGSDPLGTGKSFSQTFSKAGTYTYHCRIHSSMKATITVGG